MNHWILIVSMSTVRCVQVFPTVDNVRTSLEGYMGETNLQPLI